MVCIRDAYRPLRACPTFGSIGEITRAMLLRTHLLEKALFLERCGDGSPHFKVPLPCELVQHWFIVFGRRHQQSLHLEKHEGRTAATLKTTSTRQAPARARNLNALWYRIESCYGPARSIFRPCTPSPGSRNMMRVAHEEKTK